MEELLREYFATAPAFMLGIVIVVALFVLGKAADWLVDEAVSLSERSGIPKVVIGATVVSLGTTTPEAAVSVLAALNGVPGLALGNAVGSVICDTGLILGIATMIAPIRLDPAVVNRQGWIQLLCGVLLVAVCVPWSSPAAAFETGGVMPQYMGWVFLALLVAYIVQSIRWSRSDPGHNLEESVAGHEEDVSAPVWLVLLKLLGSVGIVVVSAQVLIPAVEEAAMRMNIPESVIAATMVAFGTSLPELVTAVSAARRGHGELALGNIVGADILNVLFVAGAAAAVTPQGLTADPHFFSVMFPLMLFVLVAFRVTVMISKTHLRKPAGAVLLLAYAVYMVISYMAGVGGGGH